MCYVFLQSLQKSNQFFCFVFEIFCAIQLMQNSKKKELSKSQNHKKSYSCMSLYKYVMAISKFLNLWLLGWLLQEYIFQMSHAFQVWKFHLKINPCEEKPCLLWADCSWEASFFFPWADFWRWRNFHTWSSAHLEILYFLVSYSWLVLSYLT